LAEWEEKEVHLREVEEECIEEADEGELVLLRRTLSDQESPNHGEQKEEEVVYAGEDDMLEFNSLLSIEKHTFSPYLETPTTLVPLPPHQIAKSHSFELDKEGGIQPPR